MNLKKFRVFIRRLRFVWKFLFKEEYYVEDFDKYVKKYLKEK